MTDLVQNVTGENMAKTRHSGVRPPRENFSEDGSKFPIAFPFHIGPRKEALRREKGEERPAVSPT